MIVPSALLHVLSEIGAVAVKKYDHHRGAFGIEVWRNVQEHAVITESLRLPKNVAGEINVAPMAVNPRIQKRLPRIWHGAVIWEGRGLEVDETCQCADVRWDARRNGLHRQCRTFERRQPDRRL